MTLPEIYETISPVAERTLQIPHFDSTVSMTSTPSWDSLNHVQLLSAIERKLGIEIGAEDAFKLTSADRLVKYLFSVLEGEAR
jgi:acyl carrier protein